MVALREWIFSVRAYPRVLETFGQARRRGRETRAERRRNYASDSAHSSSSMA